MLVGRREIKHQASPGPRLSVNTRLALAMLVVIAASSCAQQMASQPNHRPFESTEGFPDGQLARPNVYGSVPTSIDAGNPVAEPDYDKTTNTLPFPLTKEVLIRGQQRFEIYCSECHGLAGYGDGLIVQRGFYPPPSYHTDMLRNAPLGHFYDVMTKGFGAMGSYRDRVTPDDRWAIAAYIRVLQRSQYFPVSELAPDARAKLDQKQ